VYFILLALLICYYTKERNDNETYRQNTEILTAKYKKLLECNKVSLDLILNYHKRFSKQYTKNDKKVIEKYLNDLIKLNNELR